MSRHAILFTSATSCRRTCSLSKPIVLTIRRSTSALESRRRFGQSVVCSHEGLDLDIEPEIVAKYREGDIRHCVADISKAKSLLGYEPRVTLERGIPELLSWVSAQAAQDQVASATAELESRQLVR